MSKHADHTRNDNSSRSLSRESMSSRNDDKYPDAADSPQANMQSRLQAVSDDSPRAHQLKALQSKADHSPHARKMKVIQQKADNSPQAQRVMQLQSLADGSSAPAPRQNNTGLPDNLKAGIESLSELGMDDVKVHYNSYRPAQMKAHAYAQGTDIHLAPGQEKHLPHEAWHVVQQKQGRVKPTVQKTDGTNINDDAGLEAEADVMGNRAMTKSTHTSLPVQKSSDSTKAGTGPVQMVKMMFKETDGHALRDNVNSALDTVNAAVEEARGLALQWNDLENEDGYLRLWFAAASEYFFNPDTPAEFLSARFGYAVETIACRNLDRTLNGLSVDFQVTQGATRPDIVLSYLGEQIAWIDITASNSMGHIFGKAGGGWRTRLFVYEILYDSLDFKEILNGMNNELLKETGSYLADLSTVDAEEYENQVTMLRNRLIRLQSAKGWETGYGNATEKQRATREVLKTDLEMNLGNSLTGTRGALALAEVHDGPFGFNRGNVNTDSGIARGWARDQAAPVATLIKEDIKVGKVQELSMQLEDSFEYTAVPLWFNSVNLYDGHEINWGADIVANNEVIKMGIAIKHAIKAIEYISDTGLHHFLPNDRVRTVLDDIEEHKGNMPEELDLQAFKDHFARSKELEDEAFILNAELTYPELVGGDGGNGMDIEIDPS